LKSIAEMIVSATKTTESEDRPADEDEDAIGKAHPPKHWDEVLAADKRGHISRRDREDVRRLPDDAKPPATPRHRHDDDDRPEVEEECPGVETTSRHVPRPFHALATGATGKATSDVYQSGQLNPVSFS
jgi:hypothetical protein